MRDIVYEKSSDNQLAILVKSGDYAPFSILRNRYMPYIVKFAAKYDSAVEAEDLVSEGVLALFLAAKSYEPEKSAFKPFAFLCIQRGILAQYRNSKAQKRIPANMISPIDDIETADSNDPESLLIEKESFNNLFDLVKQELSDFEYRVFCEFISGKSYNEIADELGKTGKSVDNALRRVRLKIAAIKPGSY